MYDGMNPEETLEVSEILKQCSGLNYTQSYSLAKSLLNVLHRGIYYLGKKKDGFKEENEKLKEQAFRAEECLENLEHDRDCFKEDNIKLKARISELKDKLENMEFGD